MKKCNSCGALVADDSRFCTECGSSDIVPIPVDQPEQTYPEPQAPAPQQPAPQPYDAGGYPQPGSDGSQGYYQQPQPVPQPYDTGSYPPPAQPYNDGSQGYYPQPQQPDPQPYNTGSYPPPAQPYNDGTQGYYQQQQQPGNPYPFASGQYNRQPDGKKKKTGLIIAIVLGVIFLFFAVVVFIGARLVKKQLEQMDPNAYIDELISEFEEGFDLEPSVPYSKGTLTAPPPRYPTPRASWTATCTPTSGRASASPCRRASSTEARRITTRDPILIRTRALSRKMRTTAFRS